MKTDITSGLGAEVKATARVIGFFILIVAFVPVQLIVKWSGGNDLSVQRFFHGILIRLIGFRVRSRGKMEHKGPVLFVSNHSSYLDIPVLGSLLPARFVAKSEVAGWPLIGILARIQGTVFIERRRRRAGEQKDILRRVFEKGGSVILFPEGTSSNGHVTLPFKSTLFGAVEKPLDDGGVIKIQPVSIVCTQIGGLPAGRLWRPYYAWYGDMTLVGHLWNVFKIGAFTIDVIFHDAVTVESFSSRKELALHCETLVATGVDGCVTGRARA